MLKGSITDPEASPFPVFDVHAVPLTSVPYKTVINAINVFGLTKVVGSFSPCALNWAMQGRAVTEIIPAVA